VARHAAPPRPVMSRRKAVPRNTRAAQRSALFDVPADPGCADYDIDDQGTWCFIESSEHYCIYELCDPAPASPYGTFR
jgi:hypothetical protein